MYGKSLLSAEGAEWKRHRAVVMPSFNEVCHLLDLLCSFCVPSPLSHISEEDSSFDVDTNEDIQANNALVWTETIRLMREWFGELDVVTREGDYVMDCVPALSQVRLMSIYLLLRVERRADLRLN